MKRTLPKGLGAVVTGAGGGLGRAFCVELAQAGARVVVSDVAAEAAEETAAMVRELGGEARVVLADVAEWDSMRALEAASVEWLGEVDMLINNAGVVVRGAVEETSLEDWEWVMGVNVWGVIHGLRAFLPAIRARGTGYIINVASFAGLVAFPRMGAYNATKAAVVSLSETIYSDLITTDVKVAVVCPTIFQTGIMDAARGEFPAEVDQRIGRRMEKAQVQAPEIARMALDTVLKGNLYCSPMREGTVAWWLKRICPQFVQKHLTTRKSSQG